MNGAALVAVLTLALAGENRLWFVDVELSGPCESVWLECGAGGSTRLAGPFGAHENRRLRVPLPVSSPLGTSGLAGLPLPRVEILPAGAPARVRVLGWSTEQPAERLARLHGDLLARPRPQGTSWFVHAGRAELALALLAGGLVLVLRARGRKVLGVPLALAAGLALFFLARSRAEESPRARFLEWDAEGEGALAVRAARGELAGLADWLEVEPAGARIELRNEPGGGWVASARGASLSTAGPAQPPRLTRAGDSAENAENAENMEEPLEEVWTRSASGEWRSHGSWLLDDPLGPGVATAAAPPGGLAALPPGRTVFLARSASGVWLRGLGFDADGSGAQEPSDPPARDPPGGD